MVRYHQCRSAQKGAAGNGPDGRSDEQAVRDSDGRVRRGMTSGSVAHGDLAGRDRSDVAPQVGNPAVAPEAAAERAGEILAELAPR
jgi:hypothetical protein